ncbi:MAG: HAMP domain-containing sensor histidine kinase [Gammaproteobacteria bacterium]|nr:MAG: HAMP domain-containing sensor histidine kinase [Gammaproteobacteria bacterium]
MTRNSLRLRLVLASTASIAVALVLAGVVLVELFEQHVERGVKADLLVRIEALAGALAFTSDGGLSLSRELPDPRFQTPLSGLYWQIEDASGGHRLRSRSLWDTVLPLSRPAPTPGELRDAYLQGPNGGRLLVRERALIFDSSVGARLARIAVAYDSQRIEQAAAEFASGVFPALTVLAIFLSLAAAVQVWFGLRPLEKVRRGINAVRTHAAERLAGHFPDEIMPLVSEVNELLEAQTRAIEQARNRAVDLAHGLKTPLTVIANDAGRLRARGQKAIAEELEALVQTMRQHIDHELARARSAAEAGRGGVHADLPSVVSAVVSTLRRTPRGDALEWDISMPEAVQVRLDDQDLTEIVGNVIENAVKWARGKVLVRVSSSAARCTVEIGDDGPGVPKAQIHDLGRRGIRLDEKTPGTGMGLAIVHDIVSAYGGEVSLSSAEGDGLWVRIVLPADQNGE